MTALHSVLRVVFAISFPLFIVACKPVTDQTDYDYLESWDVQAITLQNRISQRVPLRIAELPATHNSFNAQAYSNGLSYPDPNHIPTMLNQLRMGKRMINMDLHWDVHYDKTTKLITTDVVLCHDSSDFGFCSIWDRTFDEGLLEIKPWLEANDEVVILKLQDELDGHYDEAHQKIASLVGDLVYSPTTPCERFDLELSKQDILDQGKKLIITGASDTSCHESWGQYVYSDEGMFGSVDYEDFEGFPYCNGLSNDIQDKIYKSTNDGTIVAQVILQSATMTAEQVASMAQCGITGISFEPMEWWDERHRAQIWSWDTHHPQHDNQRNCAIQQDSGRFLDVACNNTHRFACQHPDSREWKITQHDGQWTQGSQQCNSEYGAEGYVFATPVNGYENALLGQALANAGHTAIWLHYSDAHHEGDWLAY